ncbi:hypothetical protein MTR67_052685 [Solanum verrucosum]|uniref:Uncharacterized protein n=1 Tax=Solanum verrucosum TaxID=315347 RepID=A0AAF1A3G3_SOLVR|nr:hypothetical protein MTR67_052685 [Solanum verrucosum]
MGCTPLVPKVFKKTHVKKKENESDPDVWMVERAERTFNEFHQYVNENLDSSVQLTPELSSQIWIEKVVGAHEGRVYGRGSQNDHSLHGALVKSERRRVAKQQSMSATVQQIKEQVLNLARRPTTSSAPEDNDDDSDEEEEDFVDRTP